MQPVSERVSSDVEVEILLPGVVQLRLNRPERLNALGVDTVRDFVLALARLGELGARVLVIRGTGRAFCAGADLQARRSMDEPARRAHNRAINAACNAVAALPLPTIAALNGFTLGGGCELALACDLRLAADTAEIGLTETRIGAIPGAGGTQRLPRLVGVGRALELMLTGEPIGAARAESIGLVNAVCAPDSLDERVAELAGRLASRSPATAKLIKRVVYEGVERTLAEGLELEAVALAQVFGSRDYAEGLAAFTEKRPARFVGE